MPIGITTDVLITCLGAVLGVVLGTRLPDSLKKALNNTLGIAAIAMGIVLILKVKNLSAVVLTLVIGSILGELVMLDDRIRKLVTGVVHKLMACGMQSIGTILPRIEPKIQAVTKSRMDFVMRMLPSPVRPSFNAPYQPVPPQQNRITTALT